ncbi:MAG: asparagine synthase (glutamine-hydrolyzing) [Flavobacteriales bacterium]
MCGIAGIIHFNQTPVQLLELKQMTDVLVHRGPDGEGHWINATKNVGLGHRRLSIIDLSDAGKQPMFYAENRYTITYNGEIYNYLEIRKELQGKGYTFKSNTDTEVILAAYDYWGKDCLHQFEGMFAFALWDEKEQELFCARDRFGEKPFYYYHNEGIFVFASEMKSILSNKIVSSSINYQQLVYYLAYSHTNPKKREDTFYEKIKLLPPSHFLIFRNHELKKEKYWNYSSKKDQVKTNEEYRELLSEKLTNALKFTLRSDVPVGACLSGGIDSSILTLLLQNEFKTVPTLSTFSARYKNFSQDEGRFIEKVVDKISFNSNHVWIENTDFEKDIINFFKHQEEPVYSSSYFAEWKVCELAKQSGYKVILDGQGADEIFGGYNSTYKTYYSELLKQLSFKKFCKEKKAYQKLYGKNYQYELFDFLRAIFPSLFSELSKFKNHLYPNNNHSDIPKEIRKTFLNTTANPFVSFDSVNNFLQYLTFDHGLEQMLIRGDRNAMAHHVEVRHPFLNTSLVEYALDLPSNLKINEGWTKFILRDTYKNLLPSEIGWRKDKTGYVTPQEKWLESPTMKKMILESIDILQKEYLIEKPDKNKNWEYLMSALFILNAKNKL